MENKLNSLVIRLTEEQDIECVRPEKSAIALKECIDRNYVHVLFKKTGTELGIQLDRNKCKTENADFENSRGIISLIGGLILNYNKVKCFAEIDLSTCEGRGYLEPVSDIEYELMMPRE